MACDLAKLLEQPPDATALPPPPAKAAAAAVADPSTSSPSEDPARTKQPAEIDPKPKKKAKAQRPEACNEYCAYLVDCTWHGFGIFAGLGFGAVHRQRLQHWHVRCELEHRTHNGGGESHYPYRGATSLNNSTL